LLHIVETGTIVPTGSGGGLPGGTMIVAFRVGGTVLLKKSLFWGILMTGAG